MDFRAAPDIKLHPCREYSSSKVICGPKGLDNKIQMYRDEHSELGSNAWMMLPVAFLLGFLEKIALMSHYGSGFRVAERDETRISKLPLK